MWRIAFSTLMGLASVAVAEDAAYYRVLTENLACIADHHDIYRKMGDPVFVVVTAKCPPEEAASILDILVNEVPNPDFQDDRLDEFLSLTPEDLDCLSRTEFPETEVIRFFPAECRIEVE